jgi:hypothetical protein
VIDPTITQAPFKRLMLKQQGMRAAWEYPFAVAGVNISYMLIQLLELNSGISSSLPLHWGRPGMESNLYTCETVLLLKFKNSHV